MARLLRGRRRRRPTWSLAQGRRQPLNKARDPCFPPFATTWWCGERHPARHPVAVLTTKNPSHSQRLPPLNAEFPTGPAPTPQQGAGSTLSPLCNFAVVRGTTRRPQHRRRGRPENYAHPADSVGACVWTTRRGLVEFGAGRHHLCWYGGAPNNPLSQGRVATRTCPCARSTRQCKNSILNHQKPS